MCLSLHSKHRLWVDCLNLYLCKDEVNERVPDAFFGASMGSADHLLSPLYWQTQNLVGTVVGRAAPFQWANSVSGAHSRPCR